MLLLLTALVVACASVVLYALHSLNYWSRRGVPQLPGAYPPFGHLWKTVLLKRSFGEDCCDLYWLVPPNQPLGGAYILSKPTALVRDPELVKKILVKDFSHFHDRGFYINEDVDPLSGHLFLLGGEKWRFLRNKLSPTFTSGKMKYMFPTVEECARKMADMLSGLPPEVEFRELVARFTTDVIASCAFGLEAHCLEQPDSEFRAWGKRLVTPSTAESIIGIFCNTFPTIASIFRIRTIPAELDQYFTNLVKTTVDYRDSNKITRPDFLQLLMQLRESQADNENSEPKQQDVKDFKLNLGGMAAQCAVFFLAGFETSSTTISFALHELAWNPDVQKKLQEEVDEALGKSGGRLSYDDVMTMPYLEKVVSETLRKYPPVPVLNREVAEDYAVPGTGWVLQKGTAVVIPVLALQHDPQYFPDPERFDPERFSEQQKNERPGFTYLPFGDGPRVCIGMRFGLMQTKIGLAYLMSRCNIEPCSKTVKKLKMLPQNFVMSPTSGIWLRHTPRAR